MGFGSKWESNPLRHVVVIVSGCSRRTTPLDRAESRVEGPPSPPLPPPVLRGGGWGGGKLSIASAPPDGPISGELSIASPGSSGIRTPIHPVQVRATPHTVLREKKRGGAGHERYICVCSGITLTWSLGIRSPKYSGGFRGFRKSPLGPNNPPIRSQCAKSIQSNKSLCTMPYSIEREAQQV